MHVTLADYILELVQNAVESGADAVDLRIAEDADRIDVTISDNGCGMTAAQLESCRDPYMTRTDKHPGRKVGLGLALLSQLLEATEGVFGIDSEPGRGTRVRAQFNCRHLDTPPLGDMADLFLTALTLPGGHEMRIERKLIPGGNREDRDYTLSRSAIRATLGGLEKIADLTVLGRFLREQEETLRP